MRIGIDISQIVYEGTGVSTYVRKMVASLVKRYPEHEYVLFGASFRLRHLFSEYVASLGTDRAAVRLVTVPVPPTVLEWLWNRLHIIPVEWLIGNVDVFWSSDWTQPPLSRAVGVTTIHDLSTLRFPKESHDKTVVNLSQARIVADIVGTQRRRLLRAARECTVFFCDSEATKRDAHDALGIQEYKLKVAYPGY